MPGQMLLVLEEASKYLSLNCDKTPKSYYMRMNNGELDMLKGAFGVESISQVSTSHSLLFTNGEKFWKRMLPSVPSIMALILMKCVNCDMLFKWA